MSVFILGLAKLYKKNLKNGRGKTRQVGFWVKHFSENKKVPRLRSQRKIERKQKGSRLTCLQATSHQKKPSKSSKCIDNNLAAKGALGI